MLNFRNSIILFTLLLVGLVVVDYYRDVSWWIYLSLFFSYTLLLFYGSYFIHSEFFIPAVCRVKTTSNQVALSFDDGPDDNDTRKILDILKSNNVKATFFLIGHKVRKNPGLLKSIHEEGHLAGNHSYTHHTWFDLFPKKVMTSEIHETNQAIEEVTGKKPRWFRPPYGVTTPVLAKAIRESELTVIGWSIRSYDTVRKDAGKMVEMIRQNVQPGDIILLHDTSAVTRNSLQQIIDVIRGKGLEPVRLDQLLNIPPYA